MLLVLFAAGCSNANADKERAIPVKAAPADEPPKLMPGTETTCPVTGEKFKVKEKTIQVTHGGKRYALCCADCLPEWNKDPAKYAK